MTPIIVVSVILALLLSLLWIPIILNIDTARNEYFVQLKGLAKANVEGHAEEFLRIRLRVAFMNFYFYPLREIGASSKKKKLKKKSAKKQKTEIQTWRKKRSFMKKGFKLLKSFKVKRFLLDVDTGDPVRNAKLYPVFGFLNHHVGSFRINFENRNQLILEIQNRPIYIIKSFINL